MPTHTVTQAARICAAFHPLGLTPSARQVSRPSSSHHAPAPPTRQAQGIRLGAWPITRDRELFAHARTPTGCQERSSVFTASPQARTGHPGHLRPPSQHTTAPPKGRPAQSPSMPPKHPPGEPHTHHRSTCCIHHPSRPSTAPTRGFHPQSHTYPATTPAATPTAPSTAHPPTSPSRWAAPQGRCQYRLRFAA